MDCKNCGAKNSNTANFCAKCGTKLEHLTKKDQTTNLKNSKTFCNRVKELPKKTKIVMGIVLIIIFISLIALGLLLNNPIKKFEDSMQNYYTKIDSRQTELENIGHILKNNKKDTKALKKIKTTSKEITNKWVKNFNKDYKDKDDLKDNYKKVTTALESLYNYFKNSTALDYIIDVNTYQEYVKNLDTLYSSKINYFNGQKEEKNNNDYYAYYYYQKIVEEDYYYKIVQKFVSDFVKEEMDNLKSKAIEYLKINENSTNEEILNCYREELKYINQNKRINNIDLSDTKEYKDFYNEVALKLVEYTNKLIDEQNDDTIAIIEIINNSLSILDSKSDSYKELSDLKKSYEDKMPVKLIDEHRLISDGAGFTTWKRTINNQEYNFNLHFSFEGKNESISYSLNKKYNKFKTSIVKGEDWEDNFNGYFVISGDNKELYKSPNINNTSEVNDIEIDVSGISELKIDFITSSKASTLSTRYIYLVEPYLYK